MAKPTPQLTSLPSAGRDRRIKSFRRDLLRTNINLGFSRTSLLKKEIIKHPSNSTSLEDAVAMATPAAPSLGAPNSPKIKTALRMIFNTKARRFRIIQTVTRPMLRRIDRYTSVILQHR